MYKHQDASPQPEEIPLHSPKKGEKFQAQGSKVLKSGKSFADPAEEINDDSEIDLEFEKNLTTIDYDKMKEVVKDRHAHDNGRDYDCGDVCCRFNVGSHVCFKSSEKSDVTKFGVGVLLYFKFLKHLIFYFGIFIIFSIPALVFYGASFATYSTNTSSISYTDLLTATTIGAIGLGSSACGLAKYYDYASTPYQSIAYLSCVSGTFSSINTLSYGLVSDGSSCAFVQGTDIDASCNNYNTTYINNMFSDCIGQSSCSVLFSSSNNIFDTSTSTCTTLLKNKNIYVSLSCQSDYLQWFGTQYVLRSTISYVVASLDLAIMVIFVFMVFTLKYAQKSATSNVLKKAYSASSYTLKISNLPKSLPSEEVSEQLWHYLDGKLGNSEELGDDRVMDVQIVLPNKLIEMNKRLADVIAKKNSAIREFMELYGPQNEEDKSDTVEFKELKDILATMRNNNHPEYRNAERLHHKIKGQVIKKLKLSDEIQKLRANRSLKIVCAFVTFTSIHARNRCLDIFNYSPFSRFFRTYFECCFKNHDHFHGKILKARPSDDPDSILWANLGEPGWSIVLRRGFSAFITILLWVISAGILLVSTYYKNVFKSNYPSINCTGLDPDKSDVSVDYNLGTYQKGLLECYCSADILGRLYDYFPDSSNQQLCYNYYWDRILEKFVTLAIILVVLVINFAMQFVFQALSEFEKHSTLNKQHAQRVIKTFVAQFLNTGIIIMIVNCKFESVSFWTGKFKDITPLWYSQVGSTLLFTMVINIVTVPTVKVAGVMMDKLARVWDRGCGCNAKKTKKKTQASYENLYTGPEFIIDFRYSQILTLIYVCFLYSGGMPFLYVTSFLQLIITFYFDKFFLLRVCKLPKNYDEKLEVTIRTVLYGVVVIHLCVTIFMFGQNNIFDQTTSSFSLLNSVTSSISSSISDNADNAALKWFKRTQFYYNLIPFIGLIVCLILYVVKGFLIGFFQGTIIAAFKKDETVTKKAKRSTVTPLPVLHSKGSTKLEDDHNLPLFNVIKSADIQTLIYLTKATLHTTKNSKLKKLLEEKVEVLRLEYEYKLDEEKKGLVRKDVKFIGIFSYDIRLNARYKSQFGIEELLEEERKLENKDLQKRRDSQMLQGAPAATEIKPSGFRPALPYKKPQIASPLNANSRPPLPTGNTQDHLSPKNVVSPHSSSQAVNPYDNSERALNDKRQSRYEHPADTHKNGMPAPSERRQSRFEQVDSKTAMQTPKSGTIRYNEQARHDTKERMESRQSDPKYTEY